MPSSNGVLSSFASALDKVQRKLAKLQQAFEQFHIQDFNYFNFGGFSERYYVSRSDGVGIPGYGTAYEASVKGSGFSHFP